MVGEALWLQQKKAVCLSVAFSLVSTTLGGAPMQFALLPKRPPVYAYVGGGLEEQPKCINTIVVRIHGIASLAATWRQ